MNLVTDARLRALSREVAELRAKLDEANRRSATAYVHTTRLAQIVSVLGAHDGGAPPLEEAATQVAELFLADVCLLMLGRGQQVRIVQHWGVRERDLAGLAWTLPAHLDDLDHGQSLCEPAPHLPVPPGLDAYGLRHGVWLPLLGRDGRLGLMLLARRSDEPFGVSEIHQLHAVSDRVGLAIENSQLRTRTRAQLAHQQRLQEVTTELLATLDVDTMIARICRLVVEEGPATSATIELDAGVIGPAALVGGDDAPFDTHHASTWPLEDDGAHIGRLVVDGAATSDDADTLIGNIANVAALLIGRAILHARMRRQAERDALTGLPNRATLHEHLEAALGRRRDDSDTVAVIFIDLDRVKDVNDRLGHRVGDGLLQQVASRLRAAVRESDQVARIGGDEFVVVCESVGGVTDVERTAKRIARALTRPYAVEGHSVRISASQGIAISDGDADADRLLSDSDTAMYAAKRAGCGRVEIHVPSEASSASPAGLRSG